MSRAYLGRFAFTCTNLSKIFFICKCLEIQRTSVYGYDRLIIVLVKLNFNSRSEYATNEYQGWQVAKSNKEYRKLVASFHTCFLFLKLSTVKSEAHRPWHCVIPLQQFTVFIYRINSADVGEWNRKCGCELTSSGMRFTSSMELTIDLKVVSEGHIFTRKPYGT